MANSLDKQITGDGYRNAVVKLTGVIDTANISLFPAIALGDFKNNDQNLYLKGFRIDLIEWSISNPLELLLAWNAASPQQIYPLAGRGRIASDNYGGFLPDFTRAGMDGSIVLSSAGFVPGTVANYTIALELVKLYNR
jgi:hypothetical protein